MLYARIDTSFRTYVLGDDGFMYPVDGKAFGIPDGIMLRHDWEKGEHATLDNDSVRYLERMGYGTEITKAEYDLFHDEPITAEIVN